MIRKSFATIVKHVSVMDKLFKKLAQTFGAYIGTPLPPFWNYSQISLSPDWSFSNLHGRVVFMDIHNMDIFLLLSHLAANYFKTHDENSNLHFAWNSWLKLWRVGTIFSSSLHCLNDQLDHACHGYERYHLSWERLWLRMLMLKILMKPSRIDQEVSSIWTNLSLYCAISSQI